MSSRLFYRSPNHPDDRMVAGGVILTGDKPVAPRQTNPPLRRRVQDARAASRIEKALMSAFDMSDQEWLDRQRQEDFVAAVRRGEV